MPKARSSIRSSPTKPSQCKPSLSARRTEMLQPSEESCRAWSSLPIISTASPTAQKSQFARRPTQRAGLRRRTKVKGIRRELNRSKQRKQRKETSVVSVFLPLKSWPMHPLYQKAAGLTETIIAAAIEVHHSDNVPNQKLGKWLK